MSKKVLDLKEMLVSAKPEERVAVLEKGIDIFIRKMLLMTNDEALDHTTAFKDVGMDSITAVRLKDLINQSLGGSIELKAADIFDYPNICKLAGFIEKKLATSDDTPQSESIKDLGKDEVMRRLQEKLKEKN